MKLFGLKVSVVAKFNNNNRIQRRYSRFFTISSQRRELSPTRTLKWPGHVQHIERLSRASVMLRATWYEGTAQLLSLTELKSHLFVEVYRNVNNEECLPLVSVSKGCVALCKFGITFTSTKTEGRVPTMTKIFR